MNLAELMAAGLSEEKAKEILAGIEKTVAEATAGLKKNKEEILAEKKKEAAEKAELKKLFDGIDPEKAREALKKIEEIDTKKLKDAGEFDKLLEAERAKYAAALEQAKAETEKMRTFLNTNEVDRQLTEQLVKIGVNNPVMLKAAKAMLKDGIEVVENEGVYNVLRDGKTLEQSLTEYAATDEAKQFISAPVNAGGGSTGNTGGGTPVNIDTKVKELMAAGKHGEAQDLLARNQLAKTYEKQ